MEQVDDGSGSLVRTLNSLLRELHLQTFELEDLNDLTPSFLLVILEALLHERLPISKIIRESRSVSSKVEAMKIFLGVLAGDLLVQGGFGETVISEVAEIDPRKLARGDYEECFIIGEVLCRFAMSRGLLQVIPPERLQNESNPIPSSSGRAVNSFQRAPSPFSVEEISPPTTQQLQDSPSPSSRPKSRSRPPISSSPLHTKNHAPNSRSPSILTPVRRGAKQDAGASETSSATHGQLAKLGVNASDSVLKLTTIQSQLFPALDENAGDAEEDLSPEYHATTSFLADSSTASMLSRTSSPDQSLCHCDRTLASEADASYCTCGASLYTLPHLHGTDGDGDSAHLHQSQSQSDATLLDEENPFQQFAHSRMPLDLLTSGSGSRSLPGAPSRTRIEDKTIYAHPTLVRTSGQIERVDPDHDYNEFLQSHSQPHHQDSYSQSTVPNSRHVSQLHNDRLGPTRHSSPSEYRLALLSERARLYAEIARVRAETALEA